MTALDLQDKLVEEIPKILADYKYKDPNGDYKDINVYKQDVPRYETDEDEDPVPYIIVRLHNGEDEGAKHSNNKVVVVLIIATYDHGLDVQGYRDVMNIIDKIYARFEKEPLLKDAGVFDGEFHWALQEDAYYPYFFGSCSLNFNIPAIRREDPLA